MKKKEVMVYPFISSRQLLVNCHSVKERRYIEEVIIKALIKFRGRQIDPLSEK